MSHQLPRVSLHQVMMLSPHQVLLLLPSDIFDFTLTLTPCADGGSMYSLYGESTIDPGGVYTWEMFNPSNSQWVMIVGYGSSTFFQPVYGAVLGDVATQIRGRYLGDAGIQEVIHDITIPHLAVPDSLTVSPFGFNEPLWSSWTTAVLTRDTGNTIGWWSGVATSPDTVYYAEVVLSFVGGPSFTSWGYPLELHIHANSFAGSTLISKYSRDGCLHPIGRWVRTTAALGPPDEAFNTPEELFLT